VAKKPKQRRYPLEAFQEAIRGVGLNDELRKRLIAGVEAWKPKMGRRLEDDDQSLVAVIDLANGGMNAHAACVQVAQQFPEASRKAIKKRLYRKARPMVAFLKKEGRLARPSPTRVVGAHQALKRVFVTDRAVVSIDGTTSRILERGLHELPLHIALSLIQSKQAIEA
jgi:hypothetical protein